MTERYQLTPVELELMEILWHLEEGCVRDVMAALPQHRNLAYTSVSTVLRILEQKGVLSTKKNGKQHIYKPTFCHQTYKRHSLERVVKQVFSDNLIEILQHLVDRQNFSAEEISELQRLLDAKQSVYKVS